MEDICGRVRVLTCVRVMIVWEWIDLLGSGIVEFVDWLSG